MSDSSAAPGGGVRATIRALRPAWRRWQEHDALHMGAAIAFYSTLSLAPFLLVVATVAALLLGGDAARDYLMDRTGTLVGDDASAFLRSMLEGQGSGTAKGIAALIGAGSTLLGATATFAELQHALNRIYEVPPRVRAIAAAARSRALSLLMVVGAGLVLVLSLTLTALVTRGVGWLLDAESLVRRATLVANELVTLSVAALVFAGLLKWLPDSRVRWRAAVQGGIATALLFHAGKFLIGWYIGRTTGNGAYGAAAALVVLMLWIYWSAQIFLFGAALTAERNAALPVAAPGGAPVRTAP
jgi:membrane protein